eukprot:m.185213 g.185213  ORF g.185213 m.185213 type:complete len:780 (+) comp14727_c1_seq1:1302-3641(+)
MYSTKGAPMSTRKTWQAPAASPFGQMDDQSGQPQQSPRRTWGQPDEDMQLASVPSVPGSLEPFPNVSATAVEPSTTQTRDAFDFSGLEAAPFQETVAPTRQSPAPQTRTTITSTSTTATTAQPQRTQLQSQRTQPQRTQPQRTQPQRTQPQRTQPQSRAPPMSSETMSKADAIAARLAQEQTQVEQGVFSRLRETILDHIKDSIAAALGSIRGEIHLILQPQLVPMLNRTVGLSFLKKYGVSHYYVMQDRPPKFSDPNIHVVYLCRTELRAYKPLAEHLQFLEQHAEFQLSTTILTVPQRDALCESVLEEHGVFGAPVIKPLPIHVIPVDTDVFSFDSHEALVDIAIYKDTTSIPFAVNGLQQVLSLIDKDGKLPPTTRCVGQAADDLVKLLKVRHAVAAGTHGHGEGAKTDGASSVHAGGSCLSNAPPVTHAIVFDRRADLISPLCTQTTYPGIASEVCDIVTGQADVTKLVSENPEDAAALGSKPKVKAVFSSLTWPGFEHIRDRNFSTVTPFFKEQALDVDGFSEELLGSELRRMKQHIKSLEAVTEQKKAIHTHWSISKHVIELPHVLHVLECEGLLIEGDVNGAVPLVEGLIMRQTDPAIVVRLLAIMSLLGFASAQQKRLRDMFYNAYGFQFLLALDNLQLLTRASAIRPSEMSGIRTFLPLPPQSQMVHTYYGFRPLSSYIIESLLISKSKTRLPASLVTSARSDGPAALNLLTECIVLFVFIGGATFSELTTLRAMGKRLKFTPLFVISDYADGQTLANGLLSNDDDDEML